MSAPVLDRIMPLDLPAAEPGTGVSFLGIVRRRWPWVLVGIFIGIVGGLLAYTVRPAIYQSNAQVLVTKKQQTLTPNDFRMNYMEDYMATQTTILKSESVMTIAAKNIDPATLHTPVPGDEVERAKWLGNLLTVSREKDPNNPAMMNNVLNLSLKAPNADDAQKLLEVIIAAYRDYLKVIVAGSTKQRLDYLGIVIKATESRLNLEEQAITTLQDKIDKTTPEVTETVQSRYSKGIELLLNANDELVAVDSYLKLINDCPNNAKDRAQCYGRIAPLIRNAPQFNSSGRTDENLKFEWERSEASLAEMMKKKGKDHPDVISLKAQIDFLKERYAKNNPGDPTGTQDGLDQLKIHLEGRKQLIDSQIRNYQKDNEKNAKDLTVVLPFKNQMDIIKERVKETRKKFDIFDTERAQTELTRDSSGFQADELNKPNRDPVPVQPKMSQSLLFGIAFGLLFGVGLAALAELSDKGFRSPADIRARLGLPVIGHIPPIRTDLPVEENLDLEPTIVTALRPKSVEAEAYRGVRTALYFNAAGSTHQMIQVTSPNQGDGKSTLACNLAVSIAQSGKRTLLVDCDMRRPRVHKVFHLPEPGPGLSAVIGGNVPLSAAIQRSVIENLSILPCGKKPANPAELLTSPNFADLLDRLKSDYDYVILDTPPVLAVSDPSAVAPRADGVILVFRMTNRVRPLAERAREQLQQIGANVIGVVVNGSGRSSDGYGGYAYAYGQDYKGYTAEGGYMENYSVEDEDESPPKKG